MIEFKDKENSCLFQNLLWDTVNNILDITQTAPLICKTNRMYQVKLNQYFFMFFKKYGTKKGEGYELSINSNSPIKMTFDKIKSQQRAIDTALKNLPNSIFLSIVSQYDYFYGNLLRIIYTLSPQRRNHIAKTISFTDLENYVTIEEARNSFIQKEIDKSLRDSHEKQLETLGKLLADKGKDHNFSSYKRWTEFLEIFERRNLMVHCGGKVNKTYLKNHKSLFPEITEDTTLEISLDYLSKSSDIILDICIQLILLSWNVIEDIDNQNVMPSVMVDLSYGLMIDKQYQLIIYILESYLQNKKFKIDETEKFILTINLAQAYKWNGQTEKMGCLLSKTNWDTKKLLLRFSVHVLRDEFKKAFDCLRKISKIDEDFKKNDLLEWPLFKDLRQESDFGAVFKECYNEDYIDNKYILQKEDCELLSELDDIDDKQVKRDIEFVEKIFLK